MTDSQSLPIYIVDDDDAVREALCYVLEGYGFQVQAFECGERFLQEINLQTPGCLILDSRMPGMSGQQVHEQLNLLDACVEVIFLTSHGDLPMAVKAFRDGACDFCQKPVNAAELVPSLNKALRRSVLRERKHRYQTQMAALTAREQQLFELVVSGQRSAE